MDNQTTQMNDLKASRDQVIIRTSIIGIIANLFLALFKACVGILWILPCITGRKFLRRFVGKYRMLSQTTGS